MSFPGLTGNSFTDSSKTKKVVVISQCGSIPEIPSEDAVLVHETLNCPNDCDIRWYECISTLGRTYSILCSGCEVFITDYENGFLKEGNCDNSIYGVKNFCFGKIYISNETYNTNSCKTIFEFDDHVFEVIGNEYSDFGLYECSCNNDEIVTFGIEGKGESPPEAPEKTTPIEVLTNSVLSHATEKENRVIWSSLNESVDSFISCNAEIKLSQKLECESQDHPSVDILQSGHLIIAHEQRKENGITGIKLSVVNSSVPYKIYYHRSLSFGKLINNDQFVYGSGLLEIYDEVVFDLNSDNQPSNTLSIAFLNGPFKGQIFTILTIEKESTKSVISFDSRGIFPEFQNSNDINTIKYAILESSQSLPGGDSLDNILLLNQHTNSIGEEIPMAKPSVAVAKNHLSIDNSQNVFITYQVFENNQWNVYIRHLRLSEKEAINPQYTSYSFVDPISEIRNLTAGIGIKYIVSSISNLNSPDRTIILFKAYLDNGIEIFNCSNDDSNFTHPYGNTVSNNEATVEVVYQQSECSLDLDLQVGDEILASFPPQQSDFPDGTASGGGSCILSFSINPDEDIWCYNYSECSQSYISNDPYCPSPYLSCVYKPEDLWIIKIGDDFITRVKYHLSVNGSRVVERDTGGYGSTHLKNACVYITYKNDLSDFWTNNKTNFEFIDNAPTEDSGSKGLINFPFEISESVYGISSVHLHNIQRWVYFEETGQINYQFPNIGYFNTEKSEPILIANNSAKSVVKINNRNEIFVAYENYDNNLSQINIVGTGDFYQNSITGPKSNRITRLLESGDFVWSHQITTLDNYINEQPDFVIDNNDVIHITWRSNRDKYWEIYYANSYNVFENVKLTNLKSKCSYPKIDIDSIGNIYVVYQTNKFNTSEILISIKNDNRTFNLLEQDAYLDGYRHNYIHYTNTLPIVLENPEVLIPEEGLLWGVKAGEDFGNDGENYLFSIDVNNGDKNLGCSSSYGIKMIAASRNGRFFGIDYDKNLLMIGDEITEYGDIDCNDISVVGALDLPSNYSGVSKLVDSFNDSGNADPLKWVQKPIYTFSPIPGPGGNWTIESTNAIQSGGYLTGQDSSNFMVCGSTYGIMCFTPILSRSVRIDAKIKWVDFSPENDASPEIKFILKNNTQDSPYHSIQLKQIACVGTNCNQSLEITYSDGPSVVIEDFAPIKNTLSDIRIDCIEENGTNAGTKKLTLIVFINNVQYYRHERDNLSTSDSGLGTYYGLASYYYYNPNAPEYFTGKILVDEISYTEIDTSAIESSVPLDMSFDHAENLWILVGDRIVNGNFNLRLLKVNTTTAQTENNKTIYSGVDSRQGALTILNDGSFYIVSYRSNNAKLSSASFPIISLTDISIEFDDISNLPHNIKSITSDHLDQIYAIDDTNNLYRMSTLGNLLFLFNVSNPNDINNPYLGPDPIGTLSGITYKFSGKYLNNDENEAFNVFIDFYDNRNFDGTPYLTVSSVNNPKSFLLSNLDPMINPIELQTGESSLIYFDASHDRVGYNISYPYNFVMNQTYFPKIFISKNNKTYNIENNITFSCNKCNINNSNAIDYHACSYSVILESGEYNLIFKIYADENKINLLEEHRLFYGSIDLHSFEVNNINAASLWQSNGLTLTNDSLLTFYPNLDTDSLLKCGITYYIEILQCFNQNCDSHEIFNFNQFVCDCSSNIFNYPLKNTSQINRWISSGFGFDDHRITDTTTNKTNPSIKTRSTGAGIILFEDSNQNIKGATFRMSDPVDQFSSGTKSWFDYDLGISGIDHDLSIDLFDRIVSVYKKETISEKLPSSDIYYKICNFDESVSESVEICDISKIENNIITSDDNILNDIVQKIIVSNCDYYTYNSNEEATPVVSNCEVKLQIWGTPEIVAYRLRNENESFWSSWCEYSTEISNYYTEKNWKISDNTGLKLICFQFMTYSGITLEKCISVIADYKEINFETKFYLDNTFEDSSPTFDGLFVVSTLIDNNGFTQDFKEIFVEIIPDQIINSESINFDVIQQGSNNIYDLSASKQLNSLGQIVYRGSFVIYKEDKINNKDGLAKITPKFPGDCKSTIFKSIPEGFSKDTFNILRHKQPSETSTDLTTYRQSINGKIGVDMIIRPDEDPYFIFGDQDFFLK